jgi:phospholipid/cholesterol/gamma-HCH transport system ATP-binding protein
MISVINISKRFASQVVLDDISLKIIQGETTAIVGPSGVGKSVLLKLIMGILTPDSGRIELFGHDITAANSERERNRIRESLGVLFQAAALFDSLTIYQNIAFPLIERLGLSRKQAHAKVVRMLEALSLASIAERLPQEVSISARKRAGLARALITEPRMVLFDEPNTGLDPLVGQEVYDLIKETREAWGYTALVISHELPEVFQVADRVVMLLKGRIVEDSKPQDFVNSLNPAVQQFLHGKIDGPIRIQ